MEFNRVVKKRRMCRGFSDQTVPAEMVDQILDLATRFPSAGHAQPQEFIIVRHPRIKDELGRAALDQMFLSQAPVVLVTSPTPPGRSAGTGLEESASTASSTGRSARCWSSCRAVDLGLGAAVVAAFDDDAVRRVLAIPDNVRPIGILPIRTPSGRKWFSRRQIRPLGGEEG